MIAFDLFVGRGWALPDARERRICPPVLVPVRLPTIPLGPRGPLVYLPIRVRRPRHA